MEASLIPLALPMITPACGQALQDVLASKWLTTGPRVAAFERELQRIFMVNCIAVSSATAGLHLALRAHDIGPGDKVIVPTWTFTATAEAVEHAGATPVFADIDPVFLNITPQTVADCDNDQSGPVRAIIPVHMAGLSADVKSIAHVTRQLKAVIIEDAAHAFLAVDFNDRLVGNGRSAATVFSFYATKGLTTLGEGGLVAIREPEAARRIRAMRFHGVDREAWDRNTAGAPSPFETVSEGYKYNMSDAQAAMGLTQLPCAAEWLLARRQIAHNYATLLADLPLQLPPLLSGHAWHLYQIKLPTPDAPAFVEHMRHRGVATGIHYRPLHRNRYWREKYHLKAADYPGAEACADRVVSLPMWAGLEYPDQLKVVAAVQSYFEKRP